jgi:hypothetical protein
VAPGDEVLVQLVGRRVGDSRGDRVCLASERPQEQRTEDRVLGSGEFALFASAGRPSGEHTQVAFEVDDIEAVVAELQARGVVFESYDARGLTTVDGIADIAGNYPSKGKAERAAWFRDSEGNMLGIGQPVE